jgi:uncharacterized protein YciI
MRQLVLTIAFITVSFSFVPAQVKDSVKPVMKNYFMVFLKKGPHRNQDSLEAQKIQQAHMENITLLAKSGKLNIAGPFLDDGDLRGIFVFDVPTIEEAKNLTETDPAIKSGRLSYEIHPFMTQQGVCFK